MTTIILTIQVIIAIAMIIAILLQRSENDGFGMGSSAGGSGFMSARGKANFMTKITKYLAIAFMVNSLMFSVLVSGGGSNSIADKAQEQSQELIVPKDGEVSKPVEVPKSQ